MALVGRKPWSIPSIHSRNFHCQISRYPPHWTSSSCSLNFFFSFPESSAPSEGKIWRISSLTFCLSLPALFEFQKLRKKKRKISLFYHFFSGEMFMNHKYCFGHCFVAKRRKRESEREKYTCELVARGLKLVRFFFLTCVAHVRVGVIECGMGWKPSTYIAEGGACAARDAFLFWSVQDTSLYVFQCTGI